MKKRFIIAILVFALVGTVMTACTKNEAAKADTLESDNSKIESDDASNRETILESETETTEETAPESETQTTEVDTETETQTEMLQTDAAPEARQLEQSEVNWFTEFAQLVENNYFLSCTYAQAKDVNPNVLFYDSAGMHLYGESVTEEEKDAYAASSGQELMTDIFKLTYQQMDDFLQRKMNISFEDLTIELNWVYLPEYDAYYLQHGDTMRQDYYCTGGYVEGDMYYLDFQPYDVHLTLQKVGDDYLFIANETTFQY